MVLVLHQDPIVLEQPDDPAGTMPAALWVTWQGAKARLGRRVRVGRAIARFVAVPYYGLQADMVAYVERRPTASAAPAGWAAPAPPSP